MLHRISLGMIGYALFFLVFFPEARSKSAPETGSACGIVQDQSGAAISGVSAELRGVAGRLTTRTDSGGQFCFRSVEPGAYELEFQASGFEADHRKFFVHPGEAVHLMISLGVQSLQQQVTVAEGSADAESLNVSQTQIGGGLLHNLPSESVNAALSSVLTLATPGLAADSNGVFHPLGEHAETSFSVDGQPISDQQSRIFSDQISVSTIQDMRTIQGAPPAEFGDKTSLIVEATTRTGLNAGKSSGSISMGYGSFGTPTATATFASGDKTIGNFLAVDGINSRRFLDAPEFQPLHARGNAENLFDRLDWRPSDATSVHLNVSASHSWFQVPDTYDQLAAGQDQRQHMTSFNAALAYSRVLSPALLLTTNIWLRQDQVNYYSSTAPLSDRPATLSQSRRLTSTGARGDLVYSQGRHTLKGGVQVQVTPLSEAFSTGLTDSAFNSPCVTATGSPVPDPLLTSTAQCLSAGHERNSAYQPGLLRYDLTRGGTLFQFRGAATIFEESAYIQDGIKLGQLNVNLGMRFDNYDGLSKSDGFQPRAGIAYQVSSTGTLLHVSYARVFLTPYNENLVLSSATGAGGLANGSLGTANVQPLTTARRNQFNAGVEQKFGNKLTVEGEYFWKFTRGAYDFNSILNTPLNFPIQFRKSKIDGAMVRVTLNDTHGFSAFTVLGHSRSRLFSPEIGGINFGAAYAAVARPDHDQGFEQTTNIQYQFVQREFRGLWLGLTWRFDGGLVVVSVPDYATALTLTGDEQQEIGLYCGNVFATVSNPLRTCNSSAFSATLVHIVPPGTYNADTNPSRITPRHLFYVALGSDNIMKKDNFSLGGKITVVNLMNRVALYNFLSSFSGTHFIAPRTLQAELTFHF
jgi:hypothetical protein